MTPKKYIIISIAIVSSLFIIGFNAQAISNVIVTPDLNTQCDPNSQKLIGYDSNGAKICATDLRGNSSNTSTISAYDYIIYNDGIVTNVLNGTTGQIDFSSSDFCYVMQQTINSMKSGQSIYQRDGTFNCNSDLLINKPLSWVGTDAGTGATFRGTKIFTGNHNIVIQTSNFNFDNLWIYGASNVNRDVLQIKSPTTIGTIGKLMITGSSNSDCLHLLGDAITTVGWLNIRDLSTTNCRNDLVFDNATQSRIEYAQISAFFNHAIVSNVTDNISFGHVNISTPQTGSGCGIVLNPTTRAWHFDYLSVVTKTGQPSICDNYQIPTISPKDKIDFLEATSPIQANGHNSITAWDAFAGTWITG